MYTVRRAGDGAVLNVFATPDVAIQDAKDRSRGSESHVVDEIDRLRENIALRDFGGRRWVGIATNGRWVQGVAAKCGACNGKGVNGWSSCTACTGEGRVIRGR